MLLLKMHSISRKLELHGQIVLRSSGLQTSFDVTAPVDREEAKVVVEMGQELKQE